MKWRKPPTSYICKPLPKLGYKKTTTKELFFISYLISIHRVCFYAHSRATPELNIGRLRYDSTVQGRAIQLLPFFLLKFPFQMFVFFLRCSQILLFFFFHLHYLIFSADFWSLHKTIITRDSCKSYIFSDFPYTCFRGV